jgi:hypothetical protein
MPPYSSFQRTRQLPTLTHREPNMNRTNTATFSASSTTVRSTAWAMGLAVTLGLLGSMGQIAQHQVNTVEASLASAQPTQVVVVTGQRAARA